MKALNKAASAVEKALQSKCADEPRDEGAGDGQTVKGGAGGSNILSSAPADAGLDDEQSQVVRAVGALIAREPSADLKVCGYLEISLSRSPFTFFDACSGCLWIAQELPDLNCWTQGRACTSALLCRCATLSQVHQTVLLHRNPS